jgi:hypothetical protein
VIITETGTGKETAIETGIGKETAIETEIGREIVGGRWTGGTAPGPETERGTGEGSCFSGTFVSDVGTFGKLLRRIVCASLLLLAPSSLCNSGRTMRRLALIASTHELHPVCDAEEHLFSKSIC